jgi:hypothetical protein
MVDHPGRRKNSPKKEIGLDPRRETRLDFGPGNCVGNPNNAKFIPYIVKKYNKILKIPFDLRFSIL